MYSEERETVTVTRVVYNEMFLLPVPSHAYVLTD